MGVQGLGWSTLDCSFILEPGTEHSHGPQMAESLALHPELEPPEEEWRRFTPKAIDSNLCMARTAASADVKTQTFQQPLIKESTFNYDRDPIII